jgi:hypothetical protein
MTVFKAFYVRRRNGGPSSRLIQTFLREGVFYYLLISIANLVCLPAFIMSPSLIQAIPHHLVPDRLTESSTYSKINFSFNTPADPIGQASTGHICDQYPLERNVKPCISLSPRMPLLFIIIPSPRQLLA